MGISNPLRRGEGGKKEFAASHSSDAAPQAIVYLLKVYISNELEMQRWAFFDAGTVFRNRERK